MWKEIWLFDPHKTFQIMLMENSMENKTYYWAFHEHLIHKLNENKVAIVFSEPFTN
jgi:hypothetical protein